MTTTDARPPVGLDLGHAWVSTTKQSLDRQFDALAAAGIPAERTWTDEKAGTSLDRQGLACLLAYVDATTAGTAGGTTEVPG